MYDTCKSLDAHWFVVTTYNQWVFGTWSFGRSLSTARNFPFVLMRRLLDWTAANVLPAMPFDHMEDINVLTMLVFWVMNAWKGSHQWIMPRVRPSLS